MDAVSHYPRKRWPPMQIIQPYARMLPPPSEDDPGDDSNTPRSFTDEDGINLLKHVEWCARISHRSEDAVTHNSWQRIIKAVVLDHGDWSVTEHSSVTVDAYVDRGITHEWVRHRLFAFTQESTRFVSYAKKMPPSFVQPEGIDTDERRKWWDVAISTCEASYQRLIEAGCAPQIARSVFPNALASRIITTGNLRNWRHFLNLRTTAETHPQMKQVTIPLLLEFQRNIPLLFADIEPGSRQIDAMRRPR
jgi:thymidylate synthase (FAD)